MKLIPNKFLASDSQVKIKCDDFMNKSGNVNVIDVLMSGAGGSGAEEVGRRVRAG